MISVIISAYNVAPYIERCIHSILHQTYSDLEVIIVNDGSTDDSGAICDKLAQADNRIIVIHKDNGGSSSARNAGIDAAKGDFIAFVDGDDYIENNMYEEMLAEMSDTSISIVNCGIILTDVNGEDRILVSKEKKTYSKEEALYVFFTREGNISPSACNKLYRRELFDRGERFNNDIIHEDTEAMPRLLDASENILVMNKAFYHYVKRVNSKTTVKRFNLKGYHFLDSMKDYEKMCKTKYPAILPYFNHYELLTTYEMLLRLASCSDYRQYRLQETSLRWRILKSVFKCIRWECIRKGYIDQVKELFVRAVLGINLSNKFFYCLRKIGGNNQ